MTRNGPTVMLTVAEIRRLHDGIIGRPSTERVHVWRRRSHPSDSATAATLGDPSTSNAVAAFDGRAELLRLDCGEWIKA